MPKPSKRLIQETLTNCRIRDYLHDDLKIDTKFITPYQLRRIRKVIEKGVRK